MRQDLDRLMVERGLDALVVSGPVWANPAMAYMANGAVLSGGYVVKRRGRAPVVLCSPIERGEALASGLDVINLARYDLGSITRASSNELDAAVELHRRFLVDLGVTGRVGFYGMADPGRSWLLLRALDERLEGITVCGEFGPTVIDEARATKDEGEVARIQDVARRTCAVVAQTVAYLQSHATRGDVLVEADGSPLTLGGVHREIRRAIAQHGLEDPEGFIFSLGRDAAIPHSRGCPDDVVSLGRTMVFDIFPRTSGGYFFDLTRTFCLGFAPPEIEQAYADVLDCVRMLEESYRAGVETRRYQGMACEFLEGRGHPTVLSDPRTEHGYVHGLGHGVGLAVQEEPSFANTVHNSTVLKSGHVFTCEPGVYYPDREYGVRIADVIWIDAAGNPRRLTEYPYQLVIEM